MPPLFDRAEARRIISLCESPPTFNPQEAGLRAAMAVFYRNEFETDLEAWTFYECRRSTYYEWKPSVSVAASNAQINDLASEALANEHQHQLAVPIAPGDLTVPGNLYVEGTVHARAYSHSTPGIASPPPSFPASPPGSEASEPVSQPIVKIIDVPVRRSIMIIDHHWSDGSCHEIEAKQKAKNAALAPGLIVINSPQGKTQCSVVIKDNLCDTDPVIWINSPGDLDEMPESHWLLEVTFSGATPSFPITFIVRACTRASEYKTLLTQHALTLPDGLLYPCLGYVISARFEDDSIKMPAEAKHVQLSVSIGREKCLVPTVDL